MLINKKQWYNDDNRQRDMILSEEKGDIYTVLMKTIASTFSST